jgi:hypothetical protein
MILLVAKGEEAWELFYLFILVPLGEVPMSGKRNASQMPSITESWDLVKVSQFIEQQ